ncbi:ATP-sensitive inward rectifier potassium channel [Acrasis kona]|uniref:ATP-sensitive inward rectifier potassium channel n=1 Tax=Acrasis kona TaxID=1008807 RepID=A0AAW2ZR81_9EUKA
MKTAKDKLSHHRRLVSRDVANSFNLRRKNIPLFHNLNASNLFPYLLNLKWYRLIILLLSTLLLIHALFGLLYYCGGPGALKDVASQHRYLDCFFFSVQTMSTIGYGELKPISIYANVLVLLQTWVGLFVDCLFIGIFFGKFSRPSRLRSRIMFSSNAVVNKRGFRQNETTNDRRSTADDFFVFRIVNAHKPQFVDSKLRLLLLQWEKVDDVQISPTHSSYQKVTDEGTTLISTEMTDGFDNEYLTPVMTELDFEINAQMSRPHGMDYSCLLLPMPWMVVHKLDETSPLTPLIKGQSDKMFEVVVIFTGVEESIGDSVQSRFSYVSGEIKLDHTFRSCIQYKPKSGFEIDLLNFSHTVPTEVKCQSNNIQDEVIYNVQ